MLLPAGCFPAFEAEGCNNCYYWGSSAAWNGFLLPAPDGKVFAVDCIPAPDYRCDPTINHIDGDRETGKKLRFSLETICYLRKGETRETPEIRLRGFPNLRSWADRYIADCFPEGLKKLQEKYEGCADQSILYIGKAEGKRGLRQRLKQYMDYGRGNGNIHAGGRAVWQISDCGLLLLAYEACENAGERERQLLQEYREKNGSYPLANWRG